VNVLDLFSGIGAFSLGLERAGMNTVAFCEIDPFCRAVLSKHWPDIPIYTDVRKLNWGRLHADGIAVDVICGGWPCQDLSVAGRGEGLQGQRSGLWSDFARIIRELRPHYVVMENVAVLLSRGLDVVLGDLAQIGYDAEWHCIPAAAVGAPHRRDRIWIVAYPDGGGRGRQRVTQHSDQQCASGDLVDRCGAPGRRDRPDMGLAGGARLPLGPGTLREWAHAATTGTGWWATEPLMGRVVTRVADRVDRRQRLIALGNALVPAISEVLGRAIMQHSRHTHDPESPDRYLD
jgi:DNA (cytosine-5)-methyltransferase 1